MIVMAPSDEAELAHMVATAAAHDDGPTAIRFPRGSGTGAAVPEAPEVLPIGKGRIVREGKDIAILSLGTRMKDVLKACDALANDGIAPTVADARFAKPLDLDLIRDLVARHKVLVTVEEGSVGGFGSHVLDFLANAGLLDGGLKVRTLHMPDVFLEQDTQAGQLADAGLDADGIAQAVRAAL
jgi:1-deoxy-D-xylulose-5-phosphate synthase